MLEKLVFATLAEQRATRRWRMFWRLLWLGLFGGMAWWLLSHEGTPTSSAPHTAVVEIKGEIASGSDASAELINAALRDESIRAAMRAQGVEPAPGTPEAFEAYIRTETAKWAKVIQTANIKLD